GSRDVLAALCQRDDELDLMVQIVGAQRERNRLPVRNDRVGGLREKERRLTIGIVAHLASMRCVITTDAINAMHWKARIAAADFDRRLRRWREGVMGHGKIVKGDECRASIALGH